MAHLTTAPTPSCGNVAAVTSELRVECGGHAVVVVGRWHRHVVMLRTLLLMGLEIAVDRGGIVVILSSWLLLLLLLRWARWCRVTATEMLPIRCLTLIECCCSSCSAALERILRVKQSSLIATVACLRLLILAR